ncbi:MAG: SPOR domain-containing protein, partial [Candidatus Rokuibacteriota bacterium]
APYWVQVGAFRDAETAQRIVGKLRAENFAVPEPTKTSARVPAGTVAAATATDRYEVFVSGAPASEVDTKVTAKGMTAEPVAGGVVIKPSLVLADAVALSKDLGTEGWRVQVRRASTGPPPIAAGEALYRVRVGSFPSRTAAMAALRDLEAKGYKAFIARGGS